MTRDAIEHLYPDERADREIRRLGVLRQTDYLSDAYYCAGEDCSWEGWHSQLLNPTPEVAACPDCWERHA